MVIYDCLILSSKIHIKCIAIARWKIWLAFLPTPTGDNATLHWNCWVWYFSFIYTYSRVTPTNILYYTCVTVFSNASLRLFFFISLVWLYSVQVDSWVYLRCIKQSHGKAFYVKRNRWLTNREYTRINCTRVYCRYTSNKTMVFMRAKFPLNNRVG